MLAGWSFHAKGTTDAMEGARDWELVLALYNPYRSSCMNDSPQPKRSKVAIIIGISLMVIGIIEITAKSPVNMALGAAGNQDPVSHHQGVIGGSLLLIMGVLLIGYELKKR